MKKVLSFILSNKLRGLSICLFLLMTLQGCLSIKPAATKSAKHLFETFFVGTEGTQYFIKPLLLNKVESNDNMMMDITFRFKKEIRDSATINFSIKGGEIHRTIDSLSLTSAGTSIECQNVRLLFNEKNKKGFISRFTFKTPLSKLKTLFDNNNWEVQLHENKQMVKYRVDKKTMKAISALKNNVFVIM